MLKREQLVGRVLDRIDKVGLAALKRQFDGHSSAKYFDAGRWVTTNVARAELLGLFEGRPRRVLDLGAGFGYFLLVCRELGHETIGVDLPDPLYQAVTKLLGVTVVGHSIEPGSILPGSILPSTSEIEPPFDVVTAHMVCFNGHCSKALWGVREWSSFLDPFIGATLHLELNRERDGTLFPRGVAELFGDRGAMITGHHVVFPRVRPPRPR